MRATSNTDMLKYEWKYTANNVFLVVETDLILDSYDHINATTLNLEFMDVDNTVMLYVLTLEAEDDEDQALLDSTLFVSDLVNGVAITFLNLDDAV